MLHAVDMSLNANKSVYLTSFPSID